MIVIDRDHRPLNALDRGRGDASRLGGLTDRHPIRQSLLDLGSTLQGEVGSAELDALRPSAG